jgi:hypothetical protein
MTLKVLKALYPEGKALRSNLSVAFPESQDEGVAGVIGNVVSHITGAAGIGGFKGLNGRFARHSLMDFGAAVPSNARFTRADNGACVDLYYNPDTVPPKPEMQALLPKVMAGSADEEELKMFGELWQERVARMLIENSDNLQMIRVESCA